MLCLALSVLPDPGTAQPLKVRYAIYATVQDSSHTITGYEKIYLRNNTGEPLSSVVIKLVANDYLGDSSVLSELLLQKGDLRFYFAKADERGGYQSVDFEMAGKVLYGQPLDTYGRLTRIRLEKPLAAGDSTELNISFLLKLPRNFDGFGYQDVSSNDKGKDKGNEKGKRKGMGMGMERWTLRHWYPEIVAYNKGNQVPFDSAENKHLPSATADFDVHILVPETGHALASVPLAEKPAVSQQQAGSIIYHYRVNDQRQIQVLLEINGTQKFSEQTGWDLPEGFFRESTAAVLAKGYFDTFASDSPGKIDTGERAAMFTRLLPGPLSGKRPLDPVEMLKRIELAANGNPAGRENVSHGHQVKPAFLMNLRQTDTYHYLSVLPSIGYNHYDQVMAGIMVHNYQLPEPSFEFLLAPMLGTKSKTLTGLGRLAYNIRRPDKWWQISLDASSYNIGHYDGFTDLDGRDVPGGFKKLWRVVPALHFRAYPDIQNKKKNWGVDLRGIWLRNKDWQVTGDAFTMDYKNQAIGEIKAHLEDQRKLYPYRLEMKMDMTGDFLRLGATAHYFLNYNGQGQGLKLRAYAGKFFYLAEKNGLSVFNFGNAFLSLSGVEGTRDYTYDHYFAGRSESDGWLSQQIAKEGGFFKVATPMLNDPIGISDNWLAAVNLVTDIPDGINPFALLPFKLPVRAFVDAGTYSGAWEENPVTGRFLYDAGLQVSVFREALTVYFPLLYSKIYRDTFKSMGDRGSFVHQIRFSIQLGKLKPKVLDRILPY